MQLDILKAERIRQYEAYAEGMIGKDAYLKAKQELTRKIETFQETYEQIQEVTAKEGEMMKEIQSVKQEEERLELFGKLTRNMAEVFIDEVVIYDSQKIEIRFLFDDLIAEMKEQIEREEEVVL